MIRKLRFVFPLVGILAALGVATVQAATSATQNLTFSVPAVVSIASNGNVSAGSLTGYHWGLTRKRAMLGWEAGQVGAG